MAISAPNGLLFLCLLCLLYLQNLIAEHRTFISDYAELYFGRPVGDIWVMYFIERYLHHVIELRFQIASDLHSSPSAYQQLSKLPLNYHWIAPFPSEKGPISSLDLPEPQSENDEKVWLLYRPCPVHESFLVDKVQSKKWIYPQDDFQCPRGLWNIKRVAFTSKHDVPGSVWAVFESAFILSPC